MARVIHEMGRIGTVRSGRDENGATKTGKVLVWGKINVTSYVTGGEVVAPKDLGLENIDFITTDIRTVNNAATEPAIAALFLANYIQSTQKLIVSIDSSADAGSQVTSTQAAEIFYLAAGDAVMADLT